jgi:hypothetical protein
MANPQVRPHLHFLPEDSGSHLEEARQAARWLHELSPELTTPCVAIRAQQFYTFEPTLLTGNRVIVPVRWFTSKGRIHAQFWEMEIFESVNGPRWRVVSNPLRVAREDEFLMPFPELVRDMTAHPEVYNCPPLSHIEGAYQLSMLENL